MRKNGVILTLLILYILNLTAFSRHEMNISPLPESINNSIYSEVIIKPNQIIDKKSLSGYRFIVNGEISGEHNGKISLSDYGNSVVFKPDKPFAPNETVYVRLNSGVKTLSGDEPEPYSYRFFVSPLIVPLNSVDKSKYDEVRISDFSPEISLKALSDSLPQDLPLPVIDVINNPSRGGIFLSPSGHATSVNGTYKNYFIILDTNLNVVSYKLVPNQDNGYVGYHFKEEDNGLLSFLIRKQDGKIYLTDASYDILTSFTDSTNPYNRVNYYSNFDLLPNGNYLTVRYDFQYVDLSKYFPGGEPNGSVLQAVIQELDKNKNVIFQWRSLDNVPVNYTSEPVSAEIDYFHPNSIVPEDDGNLLICASGIGSIIKINRNTGQIKWVLGGKLNQFNFINENEENSPYYFSYQHDVRRLPNGNITLFDNGTQHVPRYSRAVEYKLDEENKTCSLIWEYRHNPDIYAEKDGSIQRLPDGNNLIAWGTYSMDGGTAFEELHPDNSVALECHFPPGLESQFIFKYPWPPCRTTASSTIYELLELNTYNFNNENNKTGVHLIMNKLNAFIYNSMTIEKYECSPLSPEFSGMPPMVFPYRLVISAEEIYSMNAEIHFTLADFPNVKYPEKAIVFYRPWEGTGVFKPLNTNYDEANNELIVLDDSLGEFIIGIPEESVIPAPPVLLSPYDNENPNIELPVSFSWNPKGYFTSSELQVAKDKDFSELILDTTMKGLTFKSEKFLKNEKYFWRVRSSNDAGLTNWSEIRNFTMSEPYLSLTIPVGGEIWDTTKHIIRWDCNLKDSVNEFFKIELFRNGNFVNNIIDSLFSAVNAYNWKIPSDTPDDSTYQVRVTSISNPQLSSVSSGFFTIKSGVTGVAENVSDNNNIEIINYPNPSNGRIFFKFKLDKSCNAVLKIYDNLGRELASAFDGVLQQGSQVLDWETTKLPAGNYIYQLNAGEKLYYGKLSIIK